ncbi:anion transporter [Desulfofustis limnaeus]|uniref:Transporter n=1 Tax=Desulfofustis limnaeus TaxID=2740163 RepID=A0ABM7WAB4_9BACT|nr:anion transporter [Desulfofustis limnaeus]BDD87890.1 transporter [Desulfofustis limnaeus]
MTALIIFVVAYAGIALGKVPGLMIDRVGVALLGAIAMVVWQVVSIEEAFAAIDLPTILLLYSLMIVSAQLRLGGFYTWVAQRIVVGSAHPRRFLLVIMLVGGVLSAVLANDIVCFALTPILALALIEARLNPMPYLLALAVASNIGSAATIIGNPQNMLIGQTGQLDFLAFFSWCAPPALASMVVSYLIILLLFRRSLRLAAATPLNTADEPGRPFDRWQSTKGLVAVVVLIGLFFTPLPREISAIGVAGLLLCSRKMKTRDITGLVDWHLITLFCALFVIIHGISRGGLLVEIIDHLRAVGIDLASPSILTGVSVLLSNLFSNVPAVMLLLGFLDPAQPEQWYVLAVSSTFAGNLFLLGSIANLIVVEQAARYHIRISVLQHALVGIPVTIASLAVLLGWLALLHGMRP